MNAFIKECFRHYSSSGGKYFIFKKTIIIIILYNFYFLGIFDRVAINDHKIKNIDIKKDFILSVSWYSAFKNPDFYNEIDKFDPDRFIGE
jgi:hypothetical protein